MVYLSFSIRSARWQASASAVCAFAPATISASRCAPRAQSFAGPRPHRPPGLGRQTSKSPRLRPNHAAKADPGHVGLRLAEQLRGSSAQPRLVSQPLRQSADRPLELIQQQPIFGAPASALSFRSSKAALRFPRRSAHVIASRTSLAVTSGITSRIAPSTLPRCSGKRPPLPPRSTARSALRRVAFFNPCLHRLERRAARSLTRSRRAQEIARVPSLAADGPSTTSKHGVAGKPAAMVLRGTGPGRGKRRALRAHLFAPSRLTRPSDVRRPRNNPVCGTKTRPPRRRSSRPRSQAPGVSSIARVSSPRADRARPMATQPHHPWGCWIFAGRAAWSRSDNLVISTTEQHAALPYQGSGHWRPKMHLHL